MRKTIVRTDRTDLGPITVKSDGRMRDLKMLSELPDGIADSWFDYVEPEDDSTRFFSYRGSWYDAYEFGLPGRTFDLEGWHACQTESVWSAVIIRYSSDWEQVVVGYAFW